MKTTFFAAGIIVLCQLKANAQITQVIDLSTGVYDGTTTLIPVNGSNTDDTWQVKAPGSSTFTSVKCAALSSYWASDPSANWISPYVDASGNALPNGGAGFFTYQMTFNANPCTVLNANIAFDKLGGDNEVTAVTVNSTVHTVSAFFGSFSIVPIALLPSEIIPGASNTITITVRNNLSSGLHVGNTYTGLFAHGNLSIDYVGDPNLVSHFSAPSVICSNEPLTLNGSASTGIAGDHVWTVVECNSSGVPIGSAATWWSPFIAGNPGSYTLPSAGSGGPIIACNKYYLVKLALQGPCDIWKESTTVVRVICSPTANAGIDQTICMGSCATIGAGKTDFSSAYTWTNSSGYVGTGKSITVCPTVTTTYTVTVTNGTTGCSATDAVTITVLNNDPVFSWTVNTSSSSYFTVLSSANDPNGYSYPGFTYSLNIEELNSGGTPLYNDGGTDAWWSYPTNDFKGFDGTVNPSGGSYTQTAWWTPMPIPAGKFLYGHNYRITRSTWNDVCSTPAYYAPIISAPPHMNILAGDKIKIYEGQDAIDFVEKLKREAIENASSDLNVYPNPSNGIFTIELNNSVKTNMEIYDMTGKKVKEEQVTGNYTLDLSDYSKGIYMIRMIINDQPVMKKIILE